MAVPLSRVESRRQQDRGPAAGQGSEQERRQGRAELQTGVRAEQWRPDEAASSGVVGQVAAARRGTASGRRLAATRRGISSGRHGITSGRRQVAATRRGISSGLRAAAR